LHRKNIIILPGISTKTSGKSGNSQGIFCQEMSRHPVKLLSNHSGIEKKILIKIVIGNNEIS